MQENTVTNPPVLDATAQAIKLKIDALITDTVGQSIVSAIDTATTALGGTPPQVNQNQGN